MFTTTENHDNFQLCALCTALQYLVCHNRGIQLDDMQEWLGENDEALLLELDADLDNFPEFTLEHFEDMWHAANGTMPTLTNVVAYADALLDVYDTQWSLYVTERARAQNTLPKE